MYKLLRCWRYFVLLCVCLATGCGTVRTEQPLSEAGIVITDEGLTGIWLAPVDPAFAQENEEEQGGVMEVSLLEDGTYHVIMRDDQGREDCIGIGKCFEIQEKLFFEFISLAENQASELKKTSAEETSGHSFFSIAREGNFLLVRWPDADAFAKLIESSDQLEGSATGWISKTVTITSQPTVFAKHLVKHHDILFSEPIRFRLDSQGTDVPVLEHKLKINASSLP